MFGDKLLLGNYEFIVDAKTRLLLPSQSGREHHDQAILMFDQDLGEYVVYPAEAIKIKFEKFDNLILNTDNVEDKRKYKLLLLEFAKSIIKDCHVDSGGRIILGNTFEPGETINIIGVNDHYVLKRKNKNN